MTTPSTRLLGDHDLTGATESGSGSGSIGAENIHCNRNRFAEMEESFLVSLMFYKILLHSGIY